MAASHLFGTQKLKTLMDTLLETIILYADVLFDPSKTKCLETECPTTHPLPQHLVRWILDKSHDMCWKIPEKTLMAGDLILDRFDIRDRSFMNKWYFFNSRTVHNFYDYKKPVTRLKIDIDEAYNEETILRIASLAHCLKEVSIRYQYISRQSLKDFSRRIMRDGPQLELSILRAECYVRCLPFRFDHESLRVLEIRCCYGLIKWLETISKCTNLRSLRISCSTKHANTIYKFLDAIPLDSKLKTLRLPRLRSSEELDRIVSRLSRLELLELYDLPTPFVISPMLGRKPKLAVHAVPYGERHNLDSVLTKCEYTQGSPTFLSFYFALISKIQKGSFEAISTEDVRRIEHVALVAAKFLNHLNIQFVGLADEIQFSEEFMLKMVCLSLSQSVTKRWDPLERFIEEFVRKNGGSLLAKKLKENNVANACVTETGRRMGDNGDGSNDGVDVDFEYDTDWDDDVDADDYDDDDDDDSG